MSRKIIILLLAMLFSLTCSMSVWAAPSVILNERYVEY